ncbi:MAG: hypothetical protein ABL985_09915 [Casimicrobium sp.]
MDFAFALFRAVGCDQEDVMPTMRTVQTSANVDERVPSRCIP